jgi:FMN phosphatase YigB (HAD superfamily)
VTLRIRWMGVDMGECLMDVTPRRAHLLTGDTARELGHPEKAEASCHRFRVMIEKYGSVPVVLERHKDELLRYVFDGEPAALDTYLRVEQEYLWLAPGAAQALASLRDRGIELSVVTAARTGGQSFQESAEYRFLLQHDVLQYFSSIVSPRGKLRLEDGAIDERYVGTSKEQGTIYTVLAADLEERGIRPDEAVMMGDKEWTDIEPAKQRGFKTILYTGYIRRGPTVADMVIQRFDELPTLLWGPGNDD